MITWIVSTVLGKVQVWHHCEIWRHKGTHVLVLPMFLDFGCIYFDI